VGRVAFVVDGSDTLKEYFTIHNLSLVHLTPKSGDSKDEQTN
jgi:hypothetical protein